MSLTDLANKILSESRGEIKISKSDKPNPKGPHLVTVSDGEYTSWNIDIGKDKVVDVVHYKEILKAVREQFPFMSHNITGEHVPVTFVEPKDYHGEKGVSGKTYTISKGYTVRDATDKDKELYTNWGIELPKADDYKVLQKDGSDVPHHRYKAGAKAPKRNKMIVGIFWDELVIDKETSKNNGRFDSRSIITSGDIFINSLNSNEVWSIPNPVQTDYFEHLINNK